MSEHTDQGILDFIRQQPVSEDPVKYDGYPYDSFLKDMEQAFKFTNPTDEQLKQIEKHNKNYRWATSEWQKLDWELIKNRINFKLRVQHIQEKLLKKFKN